MKTLTVFLTLAVFLLPGFAMPQPAQAAAPNVVVLTADDVRSAGDIETAIQMATNYGARPGSVVLDGRKGPFVYTQSPGTDWTINIFHSNLTLRGVNGAHVRGDGIFFDDLKVHHILIKDLAFTCPSDCIVSWGMHRDVKIQEMYLNAGGIGIQVAQTDGWTIRGNTIQSGSVAVHVIDSAEVNISNNHLGAYIAVQLQGANGCAVRNNRIHSEWQGILLGTNSHYNSIVGNSIMGVQASGVALEPGARGNKVHGNKVLCADNQACLTVDASGTALSDNKISGNLP